MSIACCLYYVMRFSMFSCNWRTKCLGRHRVDCGLRIVDRCIVYASMIYSTVEVARSRRPITQRIDGRALHGNILIWTRALTRIVFLVDSIPGNTLLFTALLCCAPLDRDLWFNLIFFVTAFCLAFCLRISHKVWKTCRIRI